MLKKDRYSNFVIVVVVVVVIVIVLTMFIMPRILFFVVPYGEEHSRA